MTAIPDHQASDFRVRVDLDLPMNQVEIRVNARHPAEGGWLAVTGVHEGRLVSEYDAQPDPRAELPAVLTVPRRLAEAIRDALIDELGVGPRQHAQPVSSWSAGWGTVLPEPPPHPDSVRIDRLLDALNAGLRERL